MPRPQKQYHFIYRTTCLINKRFYIGMHSTDDLNDGYMGSGTRLWFSIRRYGKENHKIEILEFFSNRKALIEREKEIINEELIKDQMCMNLQPGGCYIDFTKTRAERISIATKAAMARPEVRERYLAAQRKIYESEEYKERCKQHSIKMTGRVHSEEEKQKRAGSLKRYYKENGPSEQMAENLVSKRKEWILNMSDEERAVWKSKISLRTKESMARPEVREKLKAKRHIT